MCSSDLIRVLLFGTKFQPFFLMLIIAQPVLNIFHIFELFVLFRIFDIWKPFPIGYLDKRVGGGFGIMLDDYVAAFFGLVVYFSMQWLIQ